MAAAAAVLVGVGGGVGPSRHCDGGLFTEAGCSASARACNVQFLRSCFELLCDDRTRDAEGCGIRRRGLPERP